MSVIYRDALKGEVDETRLRREIPAPILERLQRDLLNSSLPSGPGFTAPFAGAAATTTSSTTDPGHPHPRKIQGGAYPRSSSSISSASNSSGHGGGDVRAGAGSWMGGRSDVREGVVASRGGREDRSSNVRSPKSGGGVLRSSRLRQEAVSFMVSSLVLHPLTARTG